MSRTQHGTAFLNVVLCAWDYTLRKHTNFTRIREDPPAGLQAKHGLKSMVMVGDGATDLESRQPGGADLFIG